MDKEITIKLKNQKIYSTKIDTINERIFVYIKPNAKIYFRSKDILNFADSISKTGFSKYYKTLIDTLHSTQRKIVIRDVNYSFVEEERKNFLSKTDTHYKKINETFELIGIDLILQGKFMVYSIKQRTFIEEKLKAVKSIGLYDSEYLDLIFPDKTVFYSICTSNGE